MNFLVRNEAKEMGKTKNNNKKNSKIYGFN
jgi:hypothetical protein